MRILITGGSGLLGKYLFDSMPNNCTPFWTWLTNSGALSSNENFYEHSILSYRMDIRDLRQVNDVMMKVKPDIVIHCAAVGSVDYTENNYEEVRQINVSGTGNIIKAIAPYKSKIIYISSNAVYGGRNPPYSENDRLNPINAYGIIKKNTEQVVIQSGLDYIIIRPFMLFGWPFAGGRTNWAKYIIESLRMGQEIKLVNDVYWQPTYAGSCADAIWDLALTETNEIFNVASSDRMTLYGFAQKVAQIFDLDASLIKPVKSDHFPSIAKRPKDTTYDLIKLTKRYGLLPFVESGLKRMRKEIE